MKTVSPEVRAIKGRLEPLDTLEKQKIFEQNCSENPVLLRGLDQVRTAIKSVYFDHFSIVRHWGEIVG